MTTRRKHGCLKAFAVGSSLMVALVLCLRWMVLDSVWKAETICRETPIGMSILDVDPILHHSGYRIRCTYQVMLAGEWKDLSQEEFSNALKSNKPGPPEGSRVWVRVFGVFVPASFAIVADGTGRVVEVTQPRTRG
jgi:hypothetical protein